MYIAKTLEKLVMKSDVTQNDREKDLNNDCEESQHLEFSLDFARYLCASSCSEPLLFVIGLVFERKGIQEIIPFSEQSLVCSCFL